MFERFTEKARRVIFFARYEASEYGRPEIGTEHFLLGLFREDTALARRYLPPPASLESIRHSIESHIVKRERISTSVEVPLSLQSKRALNFAAEEADRLGHRHIGTEHLLLGLLRVEDGLAAEILIANKVTLEGLRETLAKVPSPMPRFTTADGRHYTSLRVPLPSLPPTLFLEDFLAQLRAGITDFDSFFAPEVQYIDTSAQRWSGQETLAKNSKELFAPFIAPDARCEQEAILQSLDGLSMATLLWHNVQFSGGKTSLRMTVTFALAPDRGFAWRVYAIQVTPLL